MRNHQLSTEIQRSEIPLSMTDMSTRTACLGIIFALATIEPKKRRRKRLWMKEWHQKRSRFTHQALLNELSVSSPTDYKQFLRVDQETFAELLRMVEPLCRLRIDNQPVQSFAQTINHTHTRWLCLHNHPVCACMHERVYWPL